MAIATRETMEGLISEFRLMRVDLTSSVITDGEVQRLFDHDRLYLDKVNLFNDSDGKIFETPVKFIESGASIIDGSDNVLSPDATFYLEGRFTFTSRQSTTLRIKAYYHNLYMTISRAYRMVAQEDDRWKRYKRGDVELEKADVISLADKFAVDGFIPKHVRMERG